MADKKPKVIFADPAKPRTHEELRRLALDIADGKVFGSWMVQTDMVPLVFMVLAIGGPASFPSNGVAVYEYLDKAGPRSINGCPTFFTCSVLTKQDLNFLQPEVKRLVQQKRKYLNGKKP